jgi:CheY-like chemotaxis protein
MHRTYVADIERGARNVTLRSIANLAAALQMSVGSLLSQVTSSAEITLNFRDEVAPNLNAEILLVEADAVEAELTVSVFKRAKLTNPIKVVREAELGLDYVFGTGRHAKRPPMHPRLILLDLNLPRMACLEFLRRIKKEERTRDIPVVGMTSARNDRLVGECVRMGMEHHLVKPVSFDSLCRITPSFRLRWALLEPNTAEIAGQPALPRIAPMHPFPKSNDPLISAPPCVVAS